MYRLDLTGWQIYKSFTGTKDDLRKVFRDNARKSFTVKTGRSIREETTRFTYYELINLSTHQVECSGKIA